MIFKTEKGGIAGELRDRVYRKKVKHSLHFMKIYSAWGIDESIIKKLEGECDKIKVLDTESNIVYSVEFETFKKHAIKANFGTPQMFLSINKWENSSQKKLIQDEEKN